MSRNYKFHNPKGLYFVSFAVVQWLDALSRMEYKDLIVDSLTYCQKEKGMQIIAWCIMSNHMHLIYRSIAEEKPQNILGDFKRHTSKELVKAIRTHSRESRKENFLSVFEQEGRQSSNVKNYQFWRHDNKPIELWSNKVIQEKINYVHQNPVKEGLVNQAEDYRYSSAIDYAGSDGLIKDVLVVK